MAENYYGSICLSDIPKDLITTARNGKKYLNVVVNQRREVGQYGHTHYIKAYAKRGTVAPDVNLYIGELKPSDYNNEGNMATTPVSAPQPMMDTGMPPLPDYNLPF